MLLMRIVSIVFSFYILLCFFYWKIYSVEVVTHPNLRLLPRPLRRGNGVLGSLVSSLCGLLWRVSLGFLFCRVASGVEAVTHPITFASCLSRCVL